MNRRRPRHLSPDEKALWDKVKGQATPLHPKRNNDVPTEIELPAIKPPPKPQKRHAQFDVGSKAATVNPPNDIAPSLSQRLNDTPLRMDRKSFTQLKRGKLKPEGRIDLHGMTLARAHPALTAFIFDAYAKERRLVLVITGKGKDRDEGGPIPVPRGV